MSKRKIVLDERSVAEPASGSKLISTDIEFLRYAPTTDSLHIQGKRLCRWATVYFSGRNQAVRHARTFSDELLDLVPNLTPPEAQLLAREIGGRASDLSRPLEHGAVLGLLFPGFLWSAAPSAEHAAHFLVWLYQTDPAPESNKVLQLALRAFESQAEFPIRAAYTATNREMAWLRLRDWLGLGDDRSLRFPLFPHELPPELLDRVDEDLRDLSLRSKGQAHRNLGSGTSRSIMGRAAALDARYFEANPGDLTPDVLSTLASLLPRAQRSSLQRLVPTPAPPPPPRDIADLLDWFRSNYLPYREFVSAHPEPEPSLEGEIHKAARSFFPIFLDAYSDGLLEGPAHRHMNYVRMHELRSTKDRATLVVVFDGLTYSDARIVLQKISSNANPRLTAIHNETAISTLPTITKFAKPSLVLGKPPSIASDIAPPSLLAQEDKVRRALEAVKPGDLVYWSIFEPDKTYHSGAKHTSISDAVRGQLEVFGERIAELANVPPPDVAFQIVICTDHGRLMMHSQRKQPVPDGWKAHGRTAWGSTDLRFPKNGYLVQQDLVFLDAERFKLPHDVALVVDQTTFLTEDGKTGLESNPHGGIYPEEVFVPWIVVARDQKPIRITCTIMGNGQARRPGELQLTFRNPSDLPVELVDVQLTVDKEPFLLRIAMSLGPLSTKELLQPLSNWPSGEAAPLATARFTYRLPNGDVNEESATVAITSTDMYITDDLLDDLD